MSGVNIMMYYIICKSQVPDLKTAFSFLHVLTQAADIMETANIGSPLLTASIQYIINVVFTLPAIIYIDRWGRRPTLLVGSFLMMVFLFINGALQAIYGQPQTIPKSNITWIVLGN